ncbi:MAG: ABC-F family ATP-binding cassette domain-containing protein [Phycisphaerae bacterium]|nr:ABC-F family ATP-binding cassette domain-containing protein [Phycisphaerae bacterium]
MPKGLLELIDITFLYDTSTAPVFEGLCVRFPRGWTGIIGANGSGKTTLLRLVCGELAAARGRLISPDRVVYCQQRTDDPPADFEMFARADDHAACMLHGQLSIDADWPKRWETLSHGERKRAQIAVALWQQPAVLAIDEPTNHIDADARQQLSKALTAFRGIGLLVSHDRELLDSLCRHCLMIEPPGATMRPGGYTQAHQQGQAEQTAARDARDRARREVTRLKREQAKRRQAADQANKKRSKRGLALKDHDARFKINQARVTGKDGQAGRVLNQMGGRVQQARDRLAGIHTKREQRMGIAIGGEQARRDFLLRLPSGTLGMGDDRVLEFPDLAIEPSDRIALIGPNGGGKSTLVRHIRAALTFPDEKVVYLAQEIERAEGREAMRQLGSLSRREYGDIISTVSRLGSDPARVMDTKEPSPGEVRKVMLALGMARTPHLIIMDEPTNHLDLPSIECLEVALETCPSALLLVSHDMRFLDRLTRTRWILERLVGDRQGSVVRVATGSVNGQVGIAESDEKA